MMKSGGGGAKGISEAMGTHGCLLMRPMGDDGWDGGIRRNFFTLDWMAILMASTKGANWLF
jgi:hypothetical protein